MGGGFSLRFGGLPGRGFASFLRIADIRHSTDELDRTADDEPEIAIRAAAIDGDFGKAVRILIPERRARWPIAEGGCALERPRSEERRVGKERGWAGWRL